MLDPRLKTAADVKRITNLPVLATLGDLNKMNEEARKAWAFSDLDYSFRHARAICESRHGLRFISCAHGEGRSTWVEMLVGAAKERGFEVDKARFQ